MKNIDTMVRSTWLTTFPKTELTKESGQILHTQKRPWVALLLDLSLPLGWPEQMATHFPSLPFLSLGNSLKIQDSTLFFLLPRTKQQALFSPLFCYQILLNLMPQPNSRFFFLFSCPLKPTTSNTKALFLSLP